MSHKEEQIIICVCENLQARVEELPSRKQTLHQINSKGSSLPADKVKPLEKHLKVINMRWAKVIQIIFLLYYLILLAN